MPKFVSCKPQRILPVAVLGGMLAVFSLFTYLPAGQPDTPPELQKTFRGHKDAVYALAFTPDGKYLITGSFDNTLKMWDVKTGQELRTFGGKAGHSKMVLSVAVSPSGHLMASGGLDTDLKIWDVPTSSPLKSHEVNKEINSIDITSDGEKLVTGTKDGLVKIWNTKDFKELFKLSGHTGEVLKVCFSANNSIVGSSGADGTIRFWNAGNGELITVIGAHQGGANAVEISANNSTAFSVGDDGLLKFWTINTDAPRKFPPLPQEIVFMTPSSDGNQILISTADKKIRTVNFSNGQQIRELQGVDREIISGALNSNASQSVGGTKDGKLIHWNNSDGKIIGQAFAHEGPVTSMSIRPQNDRVLTAGKDGLLKLWSLPLVPSRSLDHPEAVLIGALRNDGNYLYTGTKDKMVRMWNLGNNNMERQFAGHETPVTALAISPNNSLLVSGGEDGILRFWNQGNGQQERQLGAHAGQVTSLAFNNSNNQLVSAGKDGSLKLWQVPIEDPRNLSHPDQITCVAITPDGNRLVTGCNDRNVRLWNLDNGNAERTYGGHKLPITSVAISANGGFIAGGSVDKSFTVWNLGNGQVIKKFSVPNKVTAVALNGDGKKAYAGLEDNTIRKFNVDSDDKKAKEEKKFSGHGGTVTALNYLQKDNLLLSASADKTVRLWDAGDGKLKKTMNHSGPVNSLTVSKDNKQVAAGAGKEVRIFGLPNGNEVSNFSTQADIRSLSFSPDGKRVVVGEADNFARVYNQEGQLVEFFPNKGPVLAVAYHPDAKRIISAGADKIAHVWTSGLKWEKRFSNPIHQVVFSSKNQIITSGEDKTVRVLNDDDGKELRKIDAHGGGVIGLGVDSEGDKLVSAGADKTVKVWNLEDNNNKPLASVTLKEVPQSVTMSPNGEQFAIGVGKKDAAAIRVFEVKTGKELQTLNDHKEAITMVAFRPDNQTIVSTGLDKKARISKVGVLKVYEAHKGGVTSVQFRNNGSQAISGGADKTVKFWEVEEGKVQKTFGPTKDPISFVIFSRDFEQVGAAAGKTVHIWNLDGKELSKLVHPGKVSSLSFNNDESRVVTGCEDKLTRIWQTESKEVLQFLSQESPIRSVYFHSNNNNVVSGAGKQVIVGTQGIQRVIPVSDQPLYALAQNSNGSQVLTGGADKVGTLWNAGNGNKERTFEGAKGTIRAAAISRDNDLAALGGDEKILRLYELDDAKEVKSIKTEGEIRSLQFGPKVETLAGTIGDKTVVAWNVDNFNNNQPPPENFLKTLQTFDHEGIATDVCYTNDNSILFSGSLDKTIRSWKLASPEPVKSINHPQYVDAVTFSPDGKYYASGGHDGHIRIYDVEKHNQVRDINAHQTKNETMIYGLSFSPDSKYLVSGGYDKYVRMWQVSNGNKVREIKGYKLKDKGTEKGHKDSVFSVAFSPNGQLIATGSGGQERLIKIWNASNGQLIRNLDNPEIKKSIGRKDPQSHPGWVYRLHFTKDGKYLISAGDAPRNRGYLAVWNVSNGKLVFGKEYRLGAFYSVDLDPTQTVVAIGAGPRGRPTPEFNSAYLFKLPGLK